MDRNGRCIVKCAGFATCQEVKKTAERTSSRRGGRPLKVVIMHSHIVAHQTFAQSLVSWLLGILDYSSSFRALLGTLLTIYYSNRLPFNLAICNLVIMYFEVFVIWVYVDWYAVLWPKKETWPEE